MDLDEPIRVLRVIARLNVGGPALHVSYLTSELDRIGYRTLLVAGRVSEGEGSMEYAARERGIEPVYVPSLQREISNPYGQTIPEEPRSAPYTDPAPAPSEAPAEASE